MKVLVTGGAGYIGSTVASACLDDGVQPVLLDDLSTGRLDFTRDRLFYRGDIADGALIDRIFRDHPDIKVVVHCAAVIVVSESVDQPSRYYRVNVAKTLDLVEHLRRNGCCRWVFSSSASVYGSGAEQCVDERSPLNPDSPYARTKAMVEQILADCAPAYGLQVITLRYFNPIGADPAMRTGPYAPHPSHVLGKMIEAAREGTPFEVTGTDWPTRDGSGIRDYIHVWDLARAHVQALRRFDALFPETGHRYETVNVGTGRGTTVRELLAAFQRVLGRPLTVREAGRRAGDTAGSFTRSERSRALLGWEAQLTVEDGIRDSLIWAGLSDTREAIAGPVAWPMAGSGAAPS
ncbi:UDP-glucose 4-epimerase GalE [Amorphoplanes nipponensis]|nr:UDP-glucose 4-epimerase GalE [Actinoplanes nipponensis]